MKKIYVKYKILTNGFFVDSPFICDGFVLKDGYLNDEYFGSKRVFTSKDFPIDLNYSIVNCLVDYTTKRFKYFESQNLEEFEVSDELNDSNYSTILDDYPEISAKVFDLERKLRLQFNIPVLFPIMLLQIYKEDKQLWFPCQTVMKLSSWNRAEYPIGYSESFNNSRFKFDLNSLYAVKDRHFQTAINFYDKSFEPDDVSIRFLLIFSSIEAIFNLTTENITKKISRYSAKILSEDNLEIYNSFFNDIKKLYDKRCDYIHGSKMENITIDDEILLRRYVRRIIIAYWFLMQNTKMTAKQILKYLDSNQKLDFQTRLMIAAINSSTFTEQQNKLIQLVETETSTKIPMQLKNKILEYCDKNEE